MALPFRLSTNKKKKFLVPIKLGAYKFSPYLILIVFLIPTKKKLLLILVPAKTSLFNYS